MHETYRNQVTLSRLSAPPIAKLALSGLQNSGMRPLWRCRWRSMLQSAQGLAAAARASQDDGMSLDVVDLRNFYAQPLGIVARRFIGRGIRAHWRDVQGLRV